MAKIDVDSAKKEACITSCSDNIKPALPLHKKL